MTVETKGPADNLPATTALSPVEWHIDPRDEERFHAQRPLYERLCRHVEDALKAGLDAKKLKVVAVTSRAKTVDSFREKISRKSYADPFTAMKDFAGVRVVCYYPDELPVIREVIQNHFIVSETTFKLEELSHEQFGYLADHYIVRLRPDARTQLNPELAELECEVQSRTVMQDAWAMLSHHLVYKREKDIPDALRRHIHSLAGALENADLSFQSIRDKRNTIFQQIQDLSEAREQDVPTDIDSLGAYLPTLISAPPLTEPELEKQSRSLARLFTRFDITGTYPTLADIRSLITRTATARQALQATCPTFKRSAMSELLFAVTLDGNPPPNDCAGQHGREIANRFGHLVTRRVTTGRK